MANKVAQEEGGEKVSKTYLLTSQQNRTIELTLGGKIVATFPPCGSQPVDGSVLEHPDFEGVRSWFSIQEVK